MNYIGWTIKTLVKINVSEVAISVRSIQYVLDTSYQQYWVVVSRKGYSLERTSTKGKC